MFRVISDSSHDARILRHSANSAVLDAWDLATPPQFTWETGRRKVPNKTQEELPQIPLSSFFLEELSMAWYKTFYNVRPPVSTRWTGVCSVDACGQNDCINFMFQQSFSKEGVFMTHFEPADTFATVNAAPVSDQGRTSVCF